MKKFKHVISKIFRSLVAFLTILITAIYAQPQTVASQIIDTSGCNIPAIPSYSSLPVDSLLPDPFTMMDSTRMSKKQWPCRRAEIALLAQEFEYGYKPNTPYSATTGSFNNNTITVTVTDNGKTISFNCSILFPNTGTAPYPAMIGIGGSNLDNSQLSSMGVAVINFPNNDIAQQIDAASRGKGKFYDMYGSTHSAGALMAWAWGVDRLIDAIEKTPSANIDPARLGVTGCSRNGKGALACGAFDERIVLTIPQESGSGGSASWRISDYMFAHGQNTQTLSEIVGENVWFRENFSQFKNSASKLPFDQHSIIGLVAPRAILIIENEILWLGPYSSWNCANAAQIIWQLLSVPDKMGFSATNAHGHCSFPSSQQSEVNAFVKKFLIGNGTDDTNIMRSDPGYIYDQDKWINWLRPLRPSTSVEDEHEQSSIPDGFTMDQNYPNPFNPSTTISFGIPKNLFISMKIYNSFGQEIAELAGKEFSRGRHSIMFNAKSFASDVYFCSIKAGDYTMVKKMTFLK